LCHKPNFGLWHKPSVRPSVRRLSCDVVALYGDLRHGTVYIKIFGKNSKGF